MVRLSRITEDKNSSKKRENTEFLILPLFFAGVAQFGDDLLAHHLGAVIKDFNQAAAGGAGIGHSRSQLRAGKQADDLPLVLGGLRP
jgi:hypothetical protein